MDSRTISIPHFSKRRNRSSDDDFCNVDSKDLNELNSGSNIQTNLSVLPKYIKPVAFKDLDDCGVILSSNSDFSNFGDSSGDSTVLSKLVSTRTTSATASKKLGEPNIKI